MVLGIKAGVSVQLCVADCRGVMLALFMMQGVLTYVILRPITAIMAMFAKALNFYDEGKMSPNGMWFWTGLINSISQVLPAFIFINYRTMPAVFLFLATYECG